MRLKIGDKVKLNKNIKKFRYGKGIVEYYELGTITHIDRIEKEVVVKFPSYAYWNGLESELILCNKTKFFKALPNDFTGTLEIKNGYIVEKEILDEEEKEYLSNVIKPFRDKVKFIVKKDFYSKEYIAICLPDEDIGFPSFEKGTMYKGMEERRGYTLEELGL